MLKISLTTWRPSFPDGSSFTFIYIPDCSDEPALKSKILLINCSNKDQGRLIESWEFMFVNCHCFFADNHYLIFYVVFHQKHSCLLVCLCASVVWFLCIFMSLLTNPCVPSHAPCSRPPMFHPPMSSNSSFVYSVPPLPARLFFYPVLHRPKKAPRTPRKCR